MTTTITYNPETRDYAMQLDGELVGFARTRHEAEVTLDQLRLERARLAQSSVHPDHMRLAQLHIAYGVAKSEGRLEDAARIRAEGAILMQRSPVTYSAFETAKAQVCA